MTGVKFLTENGLLCGFSVQGHSSVNCDDEQGKLVCAAVSSAAYLTANTITEVIKDNAQIEVDEAKMYVFVKNPKNETVLALKGLKLHLTELAKEYKGNIKIYSEV